MELKLTLEAILFSAQKPLSLKEIRDVLAGAPEHAEGDESARRLKKAKEAELVGALEELAREHEQAGRSFRLACVAGSWQFVTQPEYAPWLKALVGHKARPPRRARPLCLAWAEQGRPRCPASGPPPLPGACPPGK